ncbi:MAG: M28 family peptidase [Acidobacteriota bacterium]
MPALVGLLWLAGCTGQSPKSSVPPTDGTAGRLQADVYFLAADALEGRGTPSRGLDLAALYLQSQLQSAGVEPALGSSYLQAYRIGEYKPADARVSVRIAGRMISPSDYVFLNIGRDVSKGDMDLELIGAGNGIVVEERQVNDLQGLAVDGKAVVASKGAPWALDPSAVFGPDRAIGKLMAATVRGAPLLVYLSPDLDVANEAEAGFFREMKNAPVAFLRESGLGQPSALNPLLVLKPGALAAAIGATVEPLPKGPLGKRIQISIEAPVSEGSAPNVIGRISGSDAALRDEWIVLSAHFDHLGSHQVAPGQDGIWNGADDNASGTAAVLEIARRLARQPGKRSVLVFLTSGEDRGIFGSAYYAAHPAVPMERVVLQINLDMIGRSQGRVEAIAPCAPSLFDESVALGKNHGIDVIPDQQPSWRLIYLTDAYHFAKAKIPSVHFFTGLHADYHQPSDTADKVRYQEMTRIVEATWELARAYADGKSKPAFVRPAWFITP